MPLLKKKVFEKASPQEFLRDDEEVFYCELTNEIFRNYEEFAERMLLCTSMVWTCAMTGKSNLTYEEALESEENARRSISEFPVELRIPVLYVATKTKRTGFGEMAEDVFLYCKDRYFIGEKLESSFTGNKWVESHVLQVIPPNEEEITKMRSQNGNSKIPVPPASMYKYEIEHLDADDHDISEIMIVDYNQLRRRKANFSREKCKLFLKQYVQQDSNMHWIIKPAAVTEFGIDKMKFDKIFCGPEPAFDPSKRYEKKLEMASSVNGKKSRQETLAKYLTKLNEPAKMNGTPSNAKTSKESEAKSAQLLEEMEKRKEEYLRMKQQKEEEQKLVAAQLRNWNQPKEDLELEDQQPFPNIPELSSKIPDKYMGDVIMLMEFIKLFSSSLTPKKFIQGNVTLKLMERALLEVEVAGPLIDLIQMFLSAILNEQKEEFPCKATFLKSIDVSNMTVGEAARFATLAAHWPKECQGLYLRELPLYSLTVSEVLRLHLLSSGAKLQESGEKKRYYLRGGYSSNDDPGLSLRVEKPHIIKALAVKNVTQLKLKDKIEILSCLMHQLLTYPNYRDSTEDRREKNLQAKLKVKNLQRELKKCETEFNSSMFQLKRRIKKEPNVEKEMEELKKQNLKQKSKIISDLEESSKYVYEEETLLGMDRGFRKYHKLQSIPGVFIDSTEENPGVCLPEKVKQIPELVKADRQTISKYLEKNIKLLKMKSLGDETQLTNGTKENSDTESVSAKINGGLENGHGVEELDPDDGLLLCSADPQTCSVHSEKREQYKWRLLSQPESLDELMSALNKRGIREGELIDTLQMDKEQLEYFISKTPADVWCKEEDIDPQIIAKTKKTYIEANFGFPAGTPIDEILQNTLTDEILELDEKVFTGSLGQLRVKNREEWRNALSNKDYKNFDREINRRVYDAKEELVDKEEEEASEEALEVKKRFADQDPGNFLGIIKASESDSETEGEEERPSDIKEAVECLAIALAQVAHSIEPKFLEKPIGNSESRKVATYVPSKNRLEKWEKSLLASTSFSQIFLHYGTLDASIMWSRSTHQAKCRHCNRRGDSENMLLCDNCNRGFHLYCLKPKLKKVPNGDWFCDQCEAVKEKEERHILSEVLPKKKQRLFKEEEEENVQEEMQDVDSSTEEMMNEVLQVELCRTCNSGGILVTCTECETSYHKECVDPPLLRVMPKWICNECKNNSEDYEEEPRLKVQNNNDKGSRRSRRSDKEPKRYEENEDSDSGDSSKNYSKRKRSFRRECGRDDLPLHNAALQDLLQEVMKHPDAWPFLRPVKNYEVPDYHELISHPMDFGTIKYKLNMGEYQTDSQVMNDAALVFQNCNTYNQANSEIHRCGEKLLKSFRSKCEELGLELPSKLAEEGVSDRKRRRKLY
ncbi:bromodomain adjacent to zinc finger domain protein 1A isoform X2 [Coccinella septempunctata]|uniref:bromodomain adjacent to zinc finger domain protein 1A isoform X2 n=1 Tax=Coccinella septempunctata TaxID=41139 RepID=UPI001D0939B7|nr:bromodomain adjacent to zinc finger domain protein 1A isoform X2 [Coccinella septempunctata]